LIRYQVDLLNRELSDVAPLLETITVRPPDSIEIRAVGAVLQTVYNGAEAILGSFVATDSSSSKDWHRRLLVLANDRGIIDEELMGQLDQLRRFRHRFRHAYGFSLSWQLLEPLVHLIDPIRSGMTRLLDTYCSDLN
jgi:uncharacterized protein YutE (UPF0331/DUF86 family)